MPQRGISEVISFVMVIAIVITTTMAAYWWAVPAVRDLGEPGRVSSFRNQLIGLDYAVRSAAHGDVNFRNAYELDYSDAYIRLQDDFDVISFVFRQKTGVLGKPGDNVTDYNCTQETELLADNETGIMMYRASNYTRVFEGSQGGSGGGGEAEFAICYYNIDLQYGGVCEKTKTGSTIIYITKTGVTADGKPIITIDFC